MFFPVPIEYVSPTLSKIQYQLLKHDEGSTPCLLLYIFLSLDLLTYYDIFLILRVSNTSSAGLKPT
jgi:hypothetical protein